MTFVSEVRRARNKGVPLVAVRTSDQPEAARLLCEAAEAGEPIVLADPIRGFVAGNKAGREAMATMLGDLDPAMAADPVTALSVAAAAPEGTVLVLLAGDRALAEPKPACAAMLLRDTFKANGCTLVALCASWAPAAELGSDVLVFDDEAPDDAERRTIAERVVDNARQDCPELPVTESDYDAMIRFTRGLARFPVEQTIALSLNGKGVKRDVLERVYREAVAQIPGMRIESMGDGDGDGSIAGYDYLKAFAARKARGKIRYDVLMWVDEGEKLFAGTNGDTSGASQAITGGFLTCLEQTKGQGILLAGPPGAGKSNAARAIADVLGVPCVQNDINRLKDSLVGGTERNVARWAAGVRVIARNAYWVMTVNQINGLPPEIIRRFTDGTMMVDLPSPDERVAIFRMYMRIYGLPGDPPSASSTIGYSGADVRNVCREADNASMPLAEVMAEYVPSSLAAMPVIESLRRQANGAWRSASYPGPYRIPDQETPSAAKGARRMNLGGA
jgi:hypothetical protein